MMELKTQVFDAKFNDIVPAGTTLEHLATGFSFTEGPVWCGDYLLFSDIPQNRIIRYRRLARGPEITTFRSPSGNSNGLTLDRVGRLVVCEHGTRRVTRTETDGTVQVIAESYEGHRLNSPNDVVVRSDGSIFFTDPPYGLKDGRIWKEMLCNGVYRVAAGGGITLLVDDFDRPNGLAFAPDEKTLYVDDTVRGHIRAFDVDPTGGLSRGRIFAELQAGEPGAPDGMKVDCQGNIYCTGPGGIWVFNPAGNCLGRIFLQEIPANLAWGDADWRTLYITARPSLFKIRLNVPGLPVGTGI
jgi:sugar lactone lactonase YvrE